MSERTPNPLPVYEWTISVVLSRSLAVVMLLGSRPPAQSALWVQAIVAILLVALLPLHYVFLVILLGFAGFCHGVIRPARDLMVRQVVPKGSTGKVFGFVFTGQNVGGGIAPIILGTAMDNLAPQWIFYISIGFMVLCIATILTPRGPMTKAPADDVET